MVKPKRNQAEQTSGTKPHNQADSAQPCAPLNHSAPLRFWLYHYPLTPPRLPLRGREAPATTNTTTPNASRDRPMPFEKKAAKPTTQEDPTSVTNSPLHASCAANPHGYAEGLQRLFATYHPDPHG